MFQAFSCRHVASHTTNFLRFPCVHLQRWRGCVSYVQAVGFPYNRIGSSLPARGLLYQSSSSSCPKSTKTCLAEQSVRQKLLPLTGRSRTDDVAAPYCCPTPPISPQAPRLLMEQSPPRVFWVWLAQSSSPRSRRTPKASQPARFQGLSRGPSGREPRPHRRRQLLLLFL